MIVDAKTNRYICEKKREQREKRIHELQKIIIKNHDEELELIILLECEIASNNFNKIGINL